MTQAQDQARSESLKELVAQLEAKPPVVLLPEFQRDFVWEMEQTYALFDSLIRGIFVGSVIYGKPSFELTLREVDKRPRRGAGSRAKIVPKHYTEEEMKQASQQDGLKILLDGQQRTTSLYRALKGIDKVYYVVRPDAVDIKGDEFAQKSLEDLMYADDDDFDGIQGSDSPQVICVPLDYAFEYMMTVPRERDIEKFFREKTERGKALAESGDQAALDAEFEVFLQVLAKLKTMYEQQQLLSYYLLDMELDKFTTFFERSNSKGIQLNFTDILAAKVFGKFNLRQEFEKFAEANPDISVNRELLVRAVGLLTGRFDKIEKAQLLKRLTADDFVEHWEDMTGLLKQTLEYLHTQKLLVAARWLPYDNMLLPLMMFFRELNQQGKTSPSQQQWDFLRWWYWAVTFTERYTGATNDKLVQDSRVLQRVARDEPLDAKSFARFRPALQVDDLLTYTRSSSAVYRGVFNLIHFTSGGLKDWHSNANLANGPLGTKNLHDHHYFPKNFLKQSAAQQDAPDAEAIMDSILNRVLMPKDANWMATDKAPYQYLREFLEGSAKWHANPNLRESMRSHLVPESLLDDPQQSYKVEETLRERGQQIIGLIRANTVDVEDSVRAAHIPSSARDTAAP